jgi:hypothetical protein
MINLGKRLAYIGLSSPMFYDYTHSAQKVTSDASSSPNPILDSPAGLIIGYDEIWFLCRSLCPQNMRQLPYIKFLDDTDLLKGFTVTSSEIGELTSSCFTSEQMHYHQKAFSQYKDYVKATGVNWVDGVDNHSHELNIKPLASKFSANSMRAELVLFDLAIVAHLGRGFELVTNSFTQRLLTPLREVSRNKAGAKLISLRFDNYQSKKGPYHPIYDELRANPYISDFRKWIAKQHESFSPKEAEELQRDVKNILEGEQRNALLKELSGTPLATSISSILLGAMIEVVSPQLGFANSVFPSLGEQMLVESRRWQAFLIMTDSKA